MGCGSSTGTYVTRPELDFLQQQVSLPRQELESIQRRLLHLETAVHSVQQNSRSLHNRQTSNCAAATSERREGSVYRLVAAKQISGHAHGLTNQGDERRRMESGSHGMTIFRQDDVFGSKPIADWNVKPGVAVSLANASSIRPSCVEQCWKLVEATCDRQRSLRPPPPRTGWKTIRLFVSSTFSDFYSEREALVKEVFPDLRAWCQSRKIHLVECDLRWGVPKDTTSGETLRTCLGEIDRCYENNSYPFFLAIIGERCGWIPEPCEVPGVLGAQYGWVHGLSVTEMEIVHGAYRSANPNALFMIRDPAFIESVPDDVCYLYVDSNPVAPEKLTVLKNNIRRKFPSQCDDYSCAFQSVGSDARPTLTGLRGSSKFAMKVIEFFKDRIDAQYPLRTGHADLVVSQRAAHEAFLDSRSAIVLGRDEILDDIQTYINDGRCNTPLVVLGSAGAGKSAVMARSASIALKNVTAKAIPGGGKTGWTLFYHFVGAAPGSTDLGHVLQRFLRELGSFKDNMPSDLDTLVSEVHRILSSPLTTPCILFFDAANQLSDDKQTDQLLWLPEELPPNVRCILSMINQTPCHESLTERSHPPREVFCGPLNLTARKAIVTETFATYNKRLDSEQLQLLLSKGGSVNPLWLATACEELRVFGSFDRVLGKIRELGDDLPGLLQQVLERLENESGGELVIATLCLLECSRHGLLESELLLLLRNENDLLPPSDVWMESHHAVDDLKSKEEQALDVDALVVMLHEKVTMTYRNQHSSIPQPADLGIDEGEGTGFVSKTTVEPLQASKWSTVYRGLRQFLRPCGDSGEGRLDFYHRTMSKAVRRKYFESEDERYTNYQYTWWHGKLAGFFESSDDMDRRSEELPYHLEQLLDHSRLAACLVEWPMFDRLCEEQYSLDLLHSWRKAGGYKAALSCYLEALKILRESGVSREELAMRQYKVARFLCQAGNYDDAYRLLSETLEIEETELGARPEQMADLLYLLADILSEIEKLVVFISDETLRQSCLIIDYTRRSVELRRQLPGQNHERKLAVTLLLQSFHLSSITQQETDTEGITVEQALEEGKQCLKEAMQIFEKQGDKEKMADCYMTLGFLQQTGTPAEFECYEKALELCMRSVGRNHILTSRLHANIGNHYEYIGQVEKAYDYFVEWAAISTEVLGPSHPKTVCAYEVLKEPRYAAIEKRKKAENR